MEGNLLDYLQWRGDLSFRASPFNDVDALLLAELAHLHFPFAAECEMTLGQAVQKWNGIPEEERFHGLERIREQTGMLFLAAAESTRFGRVKMTRYCRVSDVQTEMEFSAVSFLLPEKTVYVSYRGTGDDLIGWKEDLNMVFMEAVPSQKEALRYAEEIASFYPDRDLILGGQSKGGNLAVWAGVHMSGELKRRLNAVYNLDGPGFIGGLTRSPEYREISERVISYVPASSIVGVLMGECPYTCIKSSSLSVLQHDPFTWMICGTAFVYENERSKSGQLIESYVDGLLFNMSRRDREEFVEKLYADLTVYHAKTVSDLKKHLFITIIKVLLDLKQFSDKSNENKQKRKELTALLREIRKSKG